jgi:hypothetical protein
VSDATKALAAITPKLRKQLHQSGAEMLAKCGLQFEFRHILGIRRPPSAFLICGKATDRGVTVDLDHKIQTGELEKESVILDVVRDAVETDPEKDSIQLDEDEKGKSIEQVIGLTKDKAVRLVKAHHGEVAPVIRPAQVARKFAINMDRFLRGRARDFREQAVEQKDRHAVRVLEQQARYLNVAARDGFDFVGEMDIVEKFQEKPLLPEQLVIRDTKTSAKSPSAEVADESHQLSAYAMASQVLDQRMPDAVKLDYLVDLKAGVKTMTVSSTRDADHLNAYLNRIVNAVSVIQSGMFTPAPNVAWWCSAKWCAYHSMCPHVVHKETSLPTLVQITKEVQQ